MNNEKNLEIKRWENKEICLEAVRQNGFTLQYVKNMAERIQKEVNKKKFETFSEMIAKHN